MHEAGYATTHHDGERDVRDVPKFAAYGCHLGKNTSETTNFGETEKDTTEGLKKAALDWRKALP